MKPGTDSIIERTTKRLLDLGYPRTAIHQEVKTAYGVVADIVIYSAESPWLVVEVKATAAFPTEQDPSLLRYNPLIRQIQATAHALAAPYFALSDGSVLLWFTTDSSGRPQLLPAPIGPSETLPTELSESKLAANAFRQLLAFLVQERTPHPDEFLGTLLLARLLRDRGQPLLEEELRSGETPSTLPGPLRAIGHRLANPRSAIEQAFLLLDSVSLATMSPHSLLMGIDDILSSQSNLLRLPRWLADLMVRLGGISGDDVVLDLHSSAGDLSTAASLAGPVREIRACCSSEISLLWTCVQQYIVSRDEPRLFLGTVPPYDVAEIRPRATRVLAAPPFGQRVQSPDGRSRSIPSDAAYLRLAIELLAPGGRAVVLVPEGLLTSAARREWRSFILQRTNLVGVIALGAFSEVTTAQGSILILDHNKVVKKGHVYFGVLNGVPKAADTFDSRTMPQVRDTLGRLAGNRNEPTTPRTSGFMVSLADISDENLSATRFLAASASPRSEAPLIPLHALAQLFRGGPTRRSDSAEGVPVIGPAAVRCAFRSKVTVDSGPK
jgi:hypothetical protein